MTPPSRIYVAGHRGLVGSAIVRALEQRGYGDIVGATHAELDLTRQADTEAFVADTAPDVVIVAAGKVGGILANNSYRAQFIAENLQIQTNLIHAAHRAGVERLLFLGSSCIYPRGCPQPMKESHLLTGPLEPTNEPYAVAKIAGIKMCEAYADQYGRAYASVMPTNLYGPGDNFDLETSHVLPALIRKFHDAKASGAESVTLWGSGQPRREFLHVDDLADACIYLLEKTDVCELVNIGTGSDVSILELAELIRRVVGFAGRIEHDRDKPDGMPRKLLDVSLAVELGWRARIELEQGIRETYEWFVQNRSSARV